MTIAKWQPASAADVLAALAIRVPPDFATKHMRADFGARFDGVTNDAAAWAAAAAFLASQPVGVKLILPPGRSVCSTAIELTIDYGKTLVIDGAGQAMSDICFGGTDGLSITLRGPATADTRAGGVRLSGFSVTNGGPAGWANTGVRITAPANVVFRVALDDIGLNGSVYGTSWLVGCELKNVQNATVDGLRYYAWAERLDPAVAATIGLLIHGDGTGAAGGGQGYVVDVHVSDTVMCGGDRHIVANGWCQGLYIQETTLIAQNTAIDVGQGAYGEAGGEFELLSLQGGTLNATSRCVRHRSGGDSQIVGVLMQQTTWAGPNFDFACIELDGANFITISGNQFQGGIGATGNTRPIAIVGASSEIAVLGNTADGFSSYFVSTEGAPDNAFTAVVIDGNVLRNVSTTHNQVIPRLVITNNAGPYVSVAFNYMNTLTVAGRDFQIDNVTGDLVAAPGSTPSLGSVVNPLGNLHLGGSAMVSGGLTTPNVVATGLLAHPIYPLAALPPVDATKKGWSAFVSNGRKAGEAAGAGTGVLAFCDGAAWISVQGGAVSA